MSSTFKDLHDSDAPLGVENVVELLHKISASHSSECEGATESSVFSQDQASKDFDGAKQTCDQVRLLAPLKLARLAWLPILERIVKACHQDCCVV